MNIRAIGLGAVILFGIATNASAQLTAAKEGPIVYGHHHLNVTSVDEHRKFWTTIGGTAIKIGVDNDREIIRFPNVLVFMTARPPKGGTKGTSVNHVGFSVPNLRQAVDKVKAAGYPIITRAELPETQPVKDDLRVHREPEDVGRVRNGPRRDEGGAGGEPRPPRRRPRCTTFTSPRSRSTT